ncbi:SubName: Full=Related to glucooligosaccharide oxidase-Laccaria bicolor {ECO:0000313/EMBL:CCA72155.1} [Serendipita indica DSM 11827]|nr:SubName: Full=Related to glucooligosaccharide oxidase-Laccaria bicolor {ECO:0000313/EMBL:CCA72155.1} [Serendipita indica DSM 11827]
MLPRQHISTDAMGNFLSKGLPTDSPNHSDATSQQNGKLGHQKGKSLTEDLSSARQFVASLLDGSYQGGDLEAFTSAHPSYNQVSKAFNKRLDPKPDLIVCPRTQQELSQLLQKVYQAKASGAPGSSLVRVVMRSGGHHYGAFSSGSADGDELNTAVVVIDLKAFATVEYDASSEVVTIGAGTRLGRVAEKLWEHRRALPHGVCPTVGIGGHAAHGGFGFTSRAWGLTLDRIVEIEAVLADGSIVIASEKQNDDLFWALRGAGPSFAVITTYKLLTVPVPAANSYFAYEWPDVRPEDSSKLLRHYQEWMSSVPAELGMAFMLLPGSRPGVNKLYMNGQYLGDWDGLRAALTPLLQLFHEMLGQPSETNEKSYTWPEMMVQLGQGTGTSDTFYASSLAIHEGHEMDEKQCLAFTTYLAQNGCRDKTEWFVMADNWGGQHSVINRVPKDKMACNARSNLYLWQFYTRMLDRQPPFDNSGIEFVKGMLDSIVNSRSQEEGTTWTYSSNVNYPDAEMSREEAQKMYYGDKVDKLRQIKTKYDPHDVFSYKQSIQPLSN